MSLASSLPQQIETVSWSRVPDDIAPSWKPSTAALLAIWPTPCSGCQCMAKAGFAGLHEVADEWDRDWRKMVQRLLSCLATFGALSQEAEVEAYENVARSGFAAILDFFPFLLFCDQGRKRLSLSLLEQVLLAVDDDQFGDVVVDYGSPPKVSLRVGSGHPIFWLTLPDESVASTLGSILSAFADGREVEEATVSWRTWFGVSSPAPAER